MTVSHSHPIYFTYPKLPLAPMNRNTGLRLIIPKHPSTTQPVPSAIIRNPKSRPPSSIAKHPVEITPANAYRGIPVMDECGALAPKLVVLLARIILSLAAEFPRTLSDKVHTW
ncbi:hypothetical protein L873DRAFT_1819090 [Choiromyces venosus 120613-1]|uniref:Uncharacterized protein n=1 Tax=Choiromyces venosus 120613-1 TaxID=1336337 RepID=A0A3N4J096_9PEZI|nr:hypothetical protein L873DRAFT_1819090 [Choiromyces venosus 120613-1]